MLNIPLNSPNFFNMIGLDPGSNTFGISLLSVNIDTMQIISSNAWTITGTKMISNNGWIEQLHGNRFSRLLEIEQNLLQVFNFYQPLRIVSESPFINQKFPQAGIALTEVLCAIKRAVMMYDVWKVLKLIPPSSVKNAIGAPGNAKKDVMKEKILQLTELNYNGEVPIEYLDEHSIDALAVVYGEWKLMVSQS